MRDARRLLALLEHSLRSQRRRTYAGRGRAVDAAHACAEHGLFPKVHRSGKEARRDAARAGRAGLHEFYTLTQNARKKGRIKL